MIHSSSRPQRSPLVTFAKTQRLNRIFESTHNSKSASTTREKKSPSGQLKEHGYCQIPLWLMVILVGLLVFVMICLITLFCLVIATEKESGYGQSCLIKKCIKGRNLKCIRGVCNCFPFEHYADKCLVLSDYKMHCTSDAVCKRNKRLNCINGTCDCQSSTYWNGKSCSERLAYKSACSGDQCLSNLNLQCDKSTQVCDCVDLTKYFWNGSNCVLKSYYGGYCSQTRECMNYQSLTCINSRCNCSEFHTWNKRKQKCSPRRDEFHTCMIDDDCMKPMQCSSNFECACKADYFFNSTSLNCEKRHLHNVNCVRTLDCRNDLGLVCLNSRCVCSTGKPVWSTDEQRCVKTLTYQQTCTSSGECDTSKRLICSSKENCNCPIKSTPGKCDCEREVGNEYYWNGTSCVVAGKYGQTCRADYECQTLTQNTYCDRAREVCACEMPGGLNSSDNCKKCNYDEVYFDDYCYFISTNVSRRDEAQYVCRNLGGHLAKVLNVRQKNFLAANLLHDNYWLSGRRIKSAYFWQPYALVASNLTCPYFDSGTTNNYEYECLYFDSKPTTECYRATNCNNLYRFVCEIK